MTVHTTYITDGRESFQEVRIEAIDIVEPYVSIEGTLRNGNRVVIQIAKKQVLNLLGIQQDETPEPNHNDLNNAALQALIGQRRVFQILVTIGGIKPTV